MVISGWKEIAKYLGSGIRSAQRWAKSHDLPVHRPVQLHKRGPVIALSEDLDEWVRRGGANERPPDDLLLRHQEIIAALRRSLDEQHRLLHLLRKERMRQIYRRHPK